MKKLILSMLLLSVSIYAGQNFRAVSMDQAILLQDGKNKNHCNVCGMTLHMFYKTNHAASHKGHDKQYCSMVCMVEDSIAYGNYLTNFRVVDNNTLKFINSSKAYFVVGSKKPGTMSMISKYAFGTKESAIKFMEENGGKLMIFDRAYDLVKESQSQTMTAIKKKQSKMIKKGKRMYRRMCQDTNAVFRTTAEAKAFLVDSKLCGNVRGKKLQAIGMYLVHRNK